MRVNEQFGTSTLAFARQAIARFDHDGSGSIELENNTGLNSMDERVFTEHRTQSKKTPYYDIWNDEWRTRTESWGERRSTSAGPLWAAADADPKDGTITDVEVATLMSKFDANRDGSLTTPEQEAFKEAHPLIVAMADFGTRHPPFGRASA